MFKIISLSILFSISFNFNLKAQVNGLGLVNIGQTTDFNPANGAQHGFFISLPSFNFNLVHNGPNFGDILGGNGGLNLNKLAEKVSSEQDLFLDSNLELLKVGFELFGYHLTVSNSTRLIGNFGYNDKLIKLFANGNAQFIGKQIDIGPSWSILAYNDLKLGVAVPFNEFISVGVGLHLLNGMGTIYSKKSDISLYTEEENYQITAITDYDIYSAGYFSFAENGIEKSNNFQFGQNIGFAFDLGVILNPNENFEVGIAFNDIGSINFKENANLNSSKGTFTFEGYELNKIIEDKDVSADGINLDSIKQIFKFENENLTNIKPILQANFVFTAKYRLNEKIELGTAFKNKFSLNKNYASLSLGGRYFITDKIKTGLSLYTLNFEKFGVGVNTVVQLGPVELFFVTDNIISLASWESFSQLNGALGINLVFGGN